MSSLSRDGQSLLLHVCIQFSLNKYLKKKKKKKRMKKKKPRKIKEIWFSLNFSLFYISFSNISWHKYSYLRYDVTKLPLAATKILGIPSLFCSVHFFISLWHLVIFYDMWLPLSVMCEVSNVSPNYLHWY